MVYQFVPAVGAKIERAGLTLAAFAERAGISVYGLRDKIHKGQLTRGATAWKLAGVYAQQCGMSEQEAFTDLFLVADVSTAPPEQRDPSRYIATRTAAALLEQTRLSQVEIAQRAGISKFSLNNALRKNTPMRGSTAWSITRVYAHARNIPADKAFTALFEEVSRESTTEYDGPDAP